MTVAATKELHEDARRRWDEAVRHAACLRFEQGESAGVIAQALGVTRSAISGMLHRARKHRAGTHSTVVVPSGHGELAGRRTPKPPKPVVELAPPPPPFTGDPIDLLHLTLKTCHWPLDGPGGLFCGAPADIRSPYCRKHRRVAYSPASAAERRAWR